MKPTPAPQKGFTLVELLISIAVLSVVVSIAIQSYHNYIREGHFATMRINMNGLRTILEDFHLDNGNFGAAGTLTGLANIDARFNWNPAGDLGSYEYTVAVIGTNSYDVWGRFQTGGTWVRCESRFSNCCDSQTNAGSDPSDPC